VRNRNHSRAAKRLCPIAAWPGEGDAVLSGRVSAPVSAPSDVPNTALVFSVLRGRTSIADSARSSSPDLHRHVVLAVFENLLPDDDTLRRQIAARAHAAGTDAYSLLRAIGHDCVGALQFLPPDSEPTPAGVIDAVPVSEREIAAILHNLATVPLGITEDESFRISIAGAQEKTALLRWNGRWYKPRGTTATTHIFKPSIGKLPNGVDLTSSVENEYLCLKILDAMGLPAAKAEIDTFGDRRVLIVERFDRLWTGDQRLLRLPQEDSCQALSSPPTLKYESDGGPGITDILKMLRGSDEPLSDQRSFLRANIAFWLLGATDGQCERLQHLPLSRWTFSHDATLRCHLRPA
jgi:serine/threonine-protein kinase HipA